MKGRITLLIVTLALLLAGSEFLIRKYLHLSPGVHTYSQWFTEVDTLVDNKGFYADNDGIFKTDPDAALYLHNRLTTFANNGVPPNNLRNACLEVYGLDRDYFEIRDTGFHGTFADYARQLRLKDTSKLDSVETAVVRYLLYPLNADGFRGIAFTNYSTSKKKILLLGDSFTWGHSAQNKTNSFADILLARGYVVYNTGISGADPAQYLAVAKKYIPELKPDYVVVNFFMGNDIFYASRKVRADHPIFYCTNAGHLLASPDGVFFSNSKETYKYAYHHFRIPPTSAFNKICATTATTTLIWKVLDKLDYLFRNGLDKYNRAYTFRDRVLYKEYWRKSDSLQKETPVCNNEVKEIEELCKANGAQFFLTVIPELRRQRLIKPDNVPHLFDSIKFEVTPGITKADYSNNDGHYNEAGQLKHANFIERLIHEHP